MRNRKGDAVPVELLLLMAAIFGTILALVFLFTVMTNLFYGECWGEPKQKLMDLKDGDNVVDFKGCVKKVVFTNDLSAVSGEIDIFEYCDRRDRDKQREQGGSFMIIIPVDKPPLKDYLKLKPRETFTKRNLLKPACIWKSYRIHGLTNVVFEGFDKKHCIHMEDTEIENVKNIAEC